MKGAPAISIVYVASQPEIRYEEGWESWMQGHEWDEMIASAKERLDKARKMADH